MRWTCIAIEQSPAAGESINKAHHCAGRPAGFRNKSAWLPGSRHRVQYPVRRQSGGPAAAAGTDCERVADKVALHRMRTCPCVWLQDMLQLMRSIMGRIMPEVGELGGRQTEWFTVARAAAQSTSRLLPCTEELQRATSSGVPASASLWLLALRPGFCAVQEVAMVSVCGSSTATP